MPIFYFILRILKQAFIQVFAMFYYIKSPNIFSLLFKTVFYSKYSSIPESLCGICQNPHKSIELQFSKTYLTTKDPFLVRIQKIQKFRKIYSPDPDSGSGIPEI